MLRFMRTKLVTVSRSSPERLEVHGVLDDDIYGLELDISFRDPDLEILSIRGTWNRWTTPECPRALMFLEQAVGWRAGEAGFAIQVHKGVGRKACRHYANLLLECSHAAREAVWADGWRKALQNDPGLTFEAFLQRRPAPETVPEAGRPSAVPPGERPESGGGREPGTEVRAADRPPGGTLVDLHVHSFPASPCGSAPVDELVEEARRCGLDAICLTDHNHVWSAQEVDALSQRHDFTVLRGNEITTTQGDILVFGFHGDVQGIIEVEDLRARVKEAGGYMIAAHPFRGFLVVGVGELGMTPEKSAERALFRNVDALEVLNGKVTRKENDFAARVSGMLGRPGTGGSDAHERSEVGRYATHFPDRIRNEGDLVRALHKGGFTPVAVRKK